MGGINIDGCRIGSELVENGRAGRKTKAGGIMEAGMKPVGFESKTGRFPANLVLSHSEHCTHEDVTDRGLFDQEMTTIKQQWHCVDSCAVKMLDEQSLASGMHGAGKARKWKSERPDTATVRFAAPGERELNRLGDSGGASRFFYCAKVSPGERNAGLDKFYSAQIDCKTWNVADTEAGQLLLRVILESMPSLSIDVCGDRITVTCPKDFLSTIKMEINKITELKIWNLLIHSLTKDCIPDVSLKKVSGLNLAHYVKNLKELMKLIGTLPDKDGSLIIDAAPVILDVLVRLKENDAWLPIKNTHPTLKPQRLMRYLIKMITPPNGIVLDPFMGSGSTGLAALQEGFSFIGIEREKEYFEIAKKRIKLNTIENSKSEKKS